MESKAITYRIEKSRRGTDTIIVMSGGREFPLHSKIDPEREAEAFEDRFDPGRYDLLIVLGVGLGYHLVPIKERIDEFYHIVLVDALQGLDDVLRKNPLTSFLTESRRVSLFSGKSAGEVESFLAEIMDMDRIRGISVLEHPASLRLFEEYYAGVKKSVNDLITVRAGNKATRRAFGPLFVRNILKNFEWLGDAMPVRDLFGAFSGYPAVIVGSGPSLDADIKALARYQDRAFIVAVDSALPVLLRNSISPDIVISIDPQPYVREHFMGAETGGALRVFSISSHPSVLARLNGYVSLNSHPFSQLAEEAYAGSIGSIDSATGSVAGDAVALCVKCGFSGIGITGLDFSFSGFAIYARGTAYQKRYGAYFQDRFTTVEGMNARYILGSSGGLTHDGRFTRKSFLHYHRALEEYIRDNDIKNIYALNERGIRLAGVRLSGMEEFMARVCPAAIGKKKAVDSARGRSRKIGIGPLRGALGRIGAGPLLEDLLAASRGAMPGPREMNKYREMIAMLEREWSGK